MAGGTKECTVLYKAIGSDILPSLSSKIVQLVFYFSPYWHLQLEHLTNSEADYMYIIIMISANL